MIEWLATSNRWKHLLVGFALGLVSVILAVVAGIYKEMRDKREWGNFDWTDLWCTIVGGVIGQSVAVAIYLAVR